MHALVFHKEKERKRLHFAYEKNQEGNKVNYSS